MKKINDNVNFLLKDTVVIDDNVEIKDNVVIYPSVYIGNNVYIGKNVTIQTGTIIKDNVYISDNCFIGSNCLIRNNVFLNKNVTIGFNCEVKHSKIDENSIISHKCFIGDALIGENVRIGCNVITANHNNNTFNKTVIKKNTKIGINCSLIAPIVIGENCFVAACSVLRQDLENNKFFKTKYEHVIYENKYVK